MDDMFEEGQTPWDMIVDLHNLVEQLVLAHNNLAKDHEAMVKALKHAETKIEELRRLQFAQYGLDNIQWPKQ